MSFGPQYLAGAIYVKEPLLKISPTKIQNLRTGHVWERHDSDMYNNRIEYYDPRDDFKQKSPGELVEGDEDVETVWAILSAQCINADDWRRKDKPEEAPPPPIPVQAPGGITVHRR